MQGPGLVVTGRSDQAVTELTAEKHSHRNAIEADCSLISEKLGGGSLVWRSAISGPGLSSLAAPPS